MKRERGDQCALLHHFVRFSVGGKAWAVAYHDIEEVLAGADITPVPKAPRFIAGITCRRGKIITLIDCAALIGLSSDVEVEGKVLWLRSDAMDIGLLAGTEIASHAISAHEARHAALKKQRTTVPGSELMVQCVGAGKDLLTVLRAQEVIAFLQKCRI